MVCLSFFSRKKVTRDIHRCSKYKVSRLTCLVIVSPAYIGQDIPVDEFFVAGCCLHEAINSEGSSKCNFGCF